MRGQTSVSPGGSQPLGAGSLIRYQQDWPTTTVELEERACHPVGMSAAVVRLKITLEGADPLIWRRIDVATTTMLKTLHLVIQAAMGWENVHLFQYDVGGYRANGGRASLADLVASGIRRFSYIYGAGAGWEHKLRIEEIGPADPLFDYPRFIDGAGRCPPEDIGDMPGFYAFLNALADPRHPGHDHMPTLRGGPFDLKAIDEDKIRTRFSKIAKRYRPSGPKRAV